MLSHLQLGSVTWDQRELTSVAAGRFSVDLMGPWAPREDGGG